MKSLISKPAIGLVLIAACAPAAFGEEGCGAKVSSGAQRGSKASEIESRAASLPCAAGFKPSAGGNASLSAVLKQLFAEKRPRGDRLKRPLPQGMLSGTVLPVDGQLIVDASAAANEGLVDVEIRGSGVTLRQPMPPSGQLALAAAPFRPGATYKAALTTRQHVYESTFTMADAATAAKVADRLRSIDSQPLDPVSRLLLQAAVYDDEELYSARDRVILELRRGLD